MIPNEVDRPVMNLTTTTWQTADERRAERPSQAAGVGGSRSRSDERNLASGPLGAEAVGVRRLGRGLRLLAWVWPLFMVGILIGEPRRPDELAACTAAWGIQWLVLVVGWRAFNRGQVDMRVLTRWDMFMFGSASWALALMGVLSGGPLSTCALCVLVVVALRGGSLALPWRTGLASVSICTLSYPSAQVYLAVTQGSMWGGPGGATELALFASTCLLLFTMAVVTLHGSHSLWALTRPLCRNRDVGRYRLLRPLARGGMGDLWIAEHAGMGSRVAIKFLRPDRMSETGVRRFTREAQVLADLAHPNTVRIYDHGCTDDGLWYYAMELLLGEDLATAVAEGGAFDEARCLDIMLQACGSLAEAHRLGIVHRDIKPQNVFLCRAGTDSDFIKVLDFGLAKREHSEGSLTRLNAVMGTPLFMSPEAIAGRPMDARSDVYGLGCLCYFLLTGRVPMDSHYKTYTAEGPGGNGETAATVLGRTLMSEELRAIVVRCLEPTPACRFEDAAALRAALTSLRTSAGSSGEPRWCENGASCRGVRSTT